jgi:hypothetical protein
MKGAKLMKVVFTCLFYTCLFFGCTGDFEEINTNPRVLTELDASTIGNMYARCQYVGFVTQPGFPLSSQHIFVNHYCQYFANTQNFFPFDRYVLLDRPLNITWNTFYLSLAGNLALVLEATDPTVNPGFETNHALAQIWRVITYERMANYWGPIPYFQTSNKASEVSYDSEEEIYRSFFTTLDDALLILNANKGGNAFGAHDQIYRGDIDKWITFGNTLRLRIAMRISEVEPALAQAEAEKAVAAGVMLSNADDAFFQVTPNSPHGMPRMIPWNEFRMSAAMESVLKGYADPRLPHFFSPAVKGGAYRGLRNGYEAVDLGNNPTLQNDTLSRIGPQWIPVSQENELPWEIILSSEVYFLRAEGALKGWDMNGIAEDLYNSGIRMSMHRWGITDDAVITAYQQSTNIPISTHDAPDPVSTIPVKFDSSDDAVALEQIATQKWLGLYPDGWEAFADLRRLDLPKMYPRMTSENIDVGADELMRRMQYVSREYELNAAAVEGGIGKLSGPDKGSTRLWWDPEM